MQVEDDDIDHGAAEEPLLNSREEVLGEDEEGQREHIGEEGEEGEVAVGWFIWLLTFAAGVSGLLFGYDTGVISSTLISIHTSLGHPLTTLDKSLITSSTSLFALLGSLPSGHLADSLGRKPIILISCLLFTAGALIQSASTTVWAMIAGRSIVGLAVGSASFVVPLYISELAPSSYRGRLVTINNLLVTGGQVVAYVVGWAFSSTPAGWRWMVGLGALPAGIQFCMLGWMPETPRWLACADRVDEAKEVLLRVYGRGERGRKVVGSVLRRVEREIEEEELVAMRVSADAEVVARAPREVRTGFWGRWMGETRDRLKELWSVGGNRRALVIACGLQGLQQLCGFNSLMYFSATIFSLLSFTNPTLTSLSIALTNFIFTLVAFHYIDLVGRRRILLFSVPIMVLGLVLCSIGFQFVHLESVEFAGEGGKDDNGPSVWAGVILVSMVTYVAGYAVGLGCVPWQQSELFPLSVRSLGSAMSTSTNWSSNFIVGLTFLPMMEVLTPTGTFGFYACVCAAGWVAIYGIYPETAGLGLEEVNGLLSKGWGVRESVRAFKSREADRDVVR